MHITAATVPRNEHNQYLCALIILRHCLKNKYTLEYLQTLQKVHIFAMIPLKSVLILTEEMLKTSLWS